MNNAQERNLSLAGVLDFPQNCRKFQNLNYWTHAAMLVEWD